MFLFLSSRLLGGGMARLHAKYMLSIKEITGLFSPLAATVTFPSMEDQHSLNPFESISLPFSIPPVSIYLRNWVICSLRGSHSLTLMLCHSV